MLPFGPFSSPRSVGQYLEALERAGFIKREGGARNIRFLKPLPIEVAPERTETTAVPVVGRIAAGLPILAEENLEGHLLVSTRVARPPHQYYLLRVHGRSMDRAGIKSGDLVLIRRQQTFQPKDIVVALVNDEATLKRVQRAGAGYLLLPDSTDRSQKPILVEEQLEIQGIVVSVLPGSSVPRLG